MAKLSTQPTASHYRKRSSIRWITALYTVAIAGILATTLKLRSVTLNNDHHYVAEDFPFRMASDAHTYRPLDCSAAVLERIKNGTLVDPNNGLIHAALTNTDPSFYISLHEQKFDRARWKIMTTRTYYEKILTAAYIKVLNEAPPDAIVLDVGGNIGWFALLAASLGHHVHVFEPSQRNHIRICESVKLNGWSTASDAETKVRKRKIGSVNLYPYGVGDKIERLLFYARADSSGMGSFVAGAAGRKKPAGNVEILTLDRFGDDHDLFSQRIAILKIDVEGYEQKVIRGSKQLLATRLIENIFIEYKSSRKGSDTMIQSLLEHNYDLFKYGNFAGPGTAPEEDKDISKLLADKCDRNHCNLWFRLRESNPDLAKKK